VDPKGHPAERLLVSAIYILQTGDLINCPLLMTRMAEAPATDWQSLPDIIIIIIYYDNRT